MKILHPALALVLLLLCNYTVAQTTAVNAGKAAMLKHMIEKYHCTPRTIDSIAEKQLLRDFVNQLDNDHLYFLQGDIDKLQQQLPMLHAQLQKGNGQFLQAILTVYKTRLQHADTAIRTILARPLEYTSAGEVTFANDSSGFAKTEAEFKTRWEHWLKYRMLYRLSNDMLADSTATKATILGAESKHRDIVRKTELRKISGILQHTWGFDNYVQYIFCNVLANAYDPHTEYFPLEDKENFEGAVSTERYQLGVVLNENDKYEIEVMHVAPGSPAWKCGEITKGDIVLKMQWEGKDVVDLSGADEDEVYNMLDEANHKKLYLTLRKANGVEKTVALMKEKMAAEESYVRSFILNGEKKLGYILLPGFYTEWESSGGSSCANDVAKEIVKLNKENIQGLILDLRNNGGGSLEEAMQLSGIFIDEGVQGFVKERNGKPQSIKDPNRGTIYDGPMLVMVNGYSASASEVVAGTLQDYNRAIIAGSPTYGKATMQIVLPLDTTINLEKFMPRARSNNTDFAKVTVGKLYRVTGKSHQLYGIVPDIAIPAIDDKLAYREATVKYALPNDTVKRAIYFNPLPPLPVNVLADKSNARIKADANFKVLYTAQAALPEVFNFAEHPLPLQFDRYVAEKRALRGKWAAIVKQLETQANNIYKVDNNSADKLKFAADVYQNEINTSILKNISNDIYLFETFRILTDFINSSK